MKENKNHFWLWKEIAQKRGWETIAYHPLGYTCPMCHKETCGFSFVDHIWMSPKGKYYHVDCALKRLKREVSIPQIRRYLAGKGK